MKNILVPTDFSEISDYGLHVAVQIAKKINAQVHLLNLITPPTGNTFAVTGDVTKTYAHEEDRFVAQLLRVNKDRLEAIAAAHAKDGIKINTLLKVEPWQEGIKDTINSLGIDLVVMGTSGETNFAEYFVGNHTEQVIRISHRPVLTVREYFTHFDIKNIVLATDLQVEAMDAIGRIKRFAEVLNAKVHLLHIRPNEDKSISEIEAALHNFADVHHISNYTVNVVKHSDEVEGIRKFSRANKADIIAVITHSRSGLSQLFKGSISEDIVKEANLPVLSINMD
ncbi:MAG: universal stress protein [Bacteroidota bacterium]|jgi:nucleotide-binding universal stress UspA family protein|nr:universal stress protein [Bacteroidota bacterium]